MNIINTNLYSEDEVMIFLKIWFR